ncbi:MAG: SufD family Fe-S cluster assembly protein [Pseudomonadota bacterium]
MALPKAKLDAAEALLAAYSKPEGTAWFSNAVSHAEQRLLDMGGPIKRDEYWKYTDPSSLVATSNDKAFQATSSDLSVAVDNADAVLMENGQIDGDIPQIAGCEIDTISKARAADIHWAKDLYGQLEAEGQKPVHRPLAALNAARAADGLAIHVTGQATQSLYIKHTHAAGASVDTMAHHIVKVDSGAEATLIEELDDFGRSNIVWEIDVAEGGSLHMIRIQAPHHDVVRSSAVFARLGKESTYKALTVSVNGAFARNENVIWFTGDDANATVAGAAAGYGSDFHHDDTVFVTHDAVNCESRQVFKKVLRNKATGVFQGKILVEPDAQKTDGYQISQGLLLDDDSQFLAKPELEIYADDVACSHGSTVGAIDQNAVFYLTSRGVPRSEAVNMLVLAFLGEAIDEVEDDDLAEMLRERLADWMSPVN